jgi:hypothetical protein
MPSAPDANTLPCFPVYWAQPGESQIQDWFNKTLVGEVAVIDATGAAGVADDGFGSLARVTDNTYLGGAAWHKNESPVMAAGSGRGTSTGDTPRSRSKAELHRAPRPSTRTCVAWTAIPRHRAPPR